MKHLLMAASLGAALVMPVSAAGTQAAAAMPLIDMHLHDHAPVPPPLREQVAVTVLSVTTREGFREDTGLAGTVLRGPAFPCHEGRIRNEAPCFPESAGWPDIEWLRGEHAAGRLQSLGELLYVYEGIDPADPRLAPYFALAEELDLPVGVHVGRGPPPDRRPPGCCPAFDDDLGNPLRLAPVLQRHPRLRLYLMHAPGWDYVDETITLMQSWPGVYAEASIMNSVMPPEAHAEAVRKLFEAELGHRLMLGSDNVPLDRIVARIQALDFLDDAQKRGILHDNAARFLRLPDPAGRFAHRLARSGDARIHYLDFGGEGDGVPLVFLQSFHGDALE